MSELGTNTMAIMKEEGVSDIRADYGLKAASLFAKALYAERQAGQNTPEAMALLDQAIEEIAKVDNATK